MKHPPRNHWPAERPQMWPLSKIKPYPKNPRAHSQEQVAALAAAMREDGVTMPILVDEKGEVIAGHARLLAAQENKFKKYPVAVARGWTDVQKRAARVRDNQLSLLSQWDDDLLRLEVGSLKIEGYDLPLLGFDSRSLDGILTADVDPAEVVPERPKTPAVHIGDRWELGEHVLFCGDATSEADVARLLDGKKPLLMVTDPPYGVDYDPNWRNEEAAKGNLAYGASRVGQVKNDDRSDWSEAWKLFSGDVAYCWHAGRHASAVQRSLESAGLMVRSQIIWAKSNYPISRGHYHWRHEPCWYAVREGKTGHWQGARDQTTLWEINLDKNVEGGHSTQKPIECMRRPIQNNSKRGDGVYDPFVGSGTTLIAAELVGRKCLAMDIDPAYCEVTILRWQNHTGKLATCEGKTLEELRAARHSGKPISRKKQNGAGKKRGVRPGLHARRPAARGEPAGEPPIVAGDS